MAVLFTKSIPEDEFLNTYNNNIVEFNSDTSGKTALYCEITISGITNPFEITPINGKFRFNFKEVVSTLINENRFQDDIKPIANIVEDNSLFLVAEVEFKIIFDDQSNETSAKNYSFLKSVEQIHSIQQRLIASDFVMNNKNITVFSGFPFDLGLWTDKTSLPINNTTNGKSRTLVTSANKTQRLWFEDGLFSLGTVDAAGESFYTRIISLPNGQVYRNDCVDYVSDPVLSIGGNIVEVGSEKVYINYVDNCGGVYLKWFNLDGSWSYWLFSEVTQTETSTSDLGYTESNGLNLNETNGTFLNLGKNGSELISLHTVSVSIEQMENIKSILTSPRIELYNGKYKDNANSQKWEVVKLNNRSLQTKNTKRNSFTVSLVIEKNLYTQV